MDFRAVDDWVSHLVEEYNGEGRFADRPFVPEREAIGSLEDRVQGKLRDLAGIEAVDGPQEVTLCHLREVMETLLARMRDDRAHPFRYLTQAVQGFPAFIERDERPRHRRVEILIGRLRRLPALVRAVVRRTGEVQPDRQAMTVEAAGNASDLLRRIGDRLTHLDRWRGTGKMEEIMSLLDDSRAACRQAAECRRFPAGGDAPIDPVPYDELLAKVFGASARDLAERTPDDVQGLLEQMEVVAQEIRPGSSPDEILAGDLRKYADGYSMLEDMKGFVRTAQGRCAEALELPAEERCIVTPVPAHLQHLFPWGGYSGPDTLAGHLTGYCYINTENLESLNSGWLMNMALHEAYPGHHTHHVCAADGNVPRTARTSCLYSRASHALEGAAHRSEEVYWEIFADPVFRLFVLYRRLHTAVRILCELKLHHYRRGDGAALQLYREHMGFPPDVARAQVRLQHMWRGYMTSYFTGFRKLRKIEERMGFDPDAFTQLIFTWGFVSVEILDMLAQLSRDERCALRDRFSRDV